MKTSVNAGSATNCPTCARPLPAGAPAGLCPACLLAQGAETESGAGGPLTRFEPPSLATIAALFPQLEILRLLGAGGMGAVYQARQPALDRFVALKVLPADADGGANFTERFNREARALARLNHPNIVAVHEFGQAGALHYFLMEFVDGANLRQLEQAGRLSPREALQIIPQICDALQYAHDEGVVHRDIKPENVLVDRKGRVKIADFGLAKMLGHDPEAARLTVEGQVMGTPHYMAPEQVERPLTVDHRADIYALGVVFYEMLTGDLPLGKFAPPSRKVQVDVRLDEIVLRALENDPARRYQQASEVKQRVADMAETPGEVPATPAGERHLRWAGLPVVVERDGKREVSFDGANKLAALVVLIVGAGLLTVHLLTGRDTSRLLGLGIAAATIMLAIRSTLRRTEPAPVKSANGTVVLPPNPKHPYLWHGLSLVAVFALVVGAHFWLPSLRQRPAVGPQAGVTRQTAEPDPQTGTLRFVLAGRGLVELLAVAPVGAPPTGWWRPDGRPLVDSPVEVAGLNLTEAPAGKTFYEFVFRAHSLAAGAEVAEINPRDGSSIRGGTVRMDGNPLNGAIRVRADLPKSANEASFEVGLGLEPWRTLARHDPAKQTHIRFRQSGEPAWDVALEHRQTTNGLAEVTGTFGPHTQGWQVRLVALDHDGVIHPEVTTVSRHEADALTSTWTFRSLPLSEVAEFQLQARPLQFVHFPAVALRPRAPADSGLVFTPPTLLTVDELVDFDVGHTANFPPAAPGENPIAGAAENMAWALEQGFDAVVGIGRLDLLSVRLAPVTAADWERMTPAAAEARLAAEGSSPRELRPMPDTTPAYAFRTRDGALGLLRIVEVTGNGQKFVLQLRHAVRSGADRQKLRAKRDAKSHALRVGLPGKGSLELLAVRPAGAVVWTHPDGQRAEGMAPEWAADFDASFPTGISSDGRHWQILMRGNQLPTPEDSLELVFQPQSLHLQNIPRATISLGDSQLGAVSLHALWPDNVRIASLRVGVPMAPWHSIGSYEPLSGSRGRTSTGNDPRWDLELHTAGVGTQGAQLTVVVGTNYPGWNIRAIATRLGGPPETGRLFGTVNNRSSVTRTFVFPQFKTLDAVQNFQVQAQPVQWVEFKDLSLPRLDRPAQP